MAERQRRIHPVALAPPKVAVGFNGKLESRHLDYYVRPSRPQRLKADLFAVATSSTVAHATVESVAFVVNFPELEIVVVKRARTRHSSGMKALFSILVGITFAMNVLAADQRSLIRQGADGVITLQAREATTHGKTIRYEPQPHKNTIGYWTKAEDWVSWEFAVTRPGQFTVTLTQACGKGSGGSDYTVGIGDELIRDTVPDTGSFTNWVERTIGTFNLATAGTYVIEVKPIKKPGLAVMDLRKIVLLPK